MVILYDVVFMGNYKALVLGLICFALIGCGIRGGQNTLADLQAEYNRAQDAIGHAEQLNAEEHSPRLLKLAKERLSTVREKQLSAPTVDVIRQYQYVQSLANRAAMNSLNQQVSAVRTDLNRRPDEISVDTSAIQEKLTVFEKRLSDNSQNLTDNSQSIDALAQRDDRQNARLDRLEDTVARIDKVSMQLDRVKSRLTRSPPTKLGDTLSRLLDTVREHEEAIEQLCQGVKTLDQQLTAHRKRIGEEVQGSRDKFVYPTDSPGLVGYWPFESNGGKYFEDASGNLSVGRTVGTLEQTDGIFGTRGISFRRSGSLIGVSDHPDLDPGSDSDFAISTWFNAESLDGEAYLLNKWSIKNNIGWYLSLSPDGLNFTMQSGGGSLTAESSGDYLNNRWHHVTVVYARRDGRSNSGRLKLYVDGELRAETTGKVSLNTSQFLSIGGSAQQTNKYFTGRLDELRLYRKALDKRAVQNLAAEPEVPVAEVCDYEAADSSGVPTAQPKTSRQSRTTRRSRLRETRDETQRDTGLIAHWSLDDTGNEVVKDLAGEADGKIHGAKTGVSGKVERAMVFKGDTDRIRVNNRPVFENLEALTLTAWVRPEEFARQYILTKGIPEDGTMASPYGLSLTEDQDIVFSVNTTEGFNQIRKVGYDRDEWLFLAGTFGGSTASLYVDGEKVSEMNVEGRLKTNDLPIFLGSRYGAFGGMNGRLDDVRIYNYALSKTEIKKLPGL